MRRPRGVPGRADASGSPVSPVCRGIERGRSGLVHPRYSTTTSRRPASTEAPAWTSTCLTVPALGDRSSFSIFMASTTTSGLSGLDLVPGVHEHAQHLAGHGRRHPRAPVAAPPPAGPRRARPFSATVTARPATETSSSPAARPAPVSDLVAGAPLVLDEDERQGAAVERDGVHHVRAAVDLDAEHGGARARTPRSTRSTRTCRGRPSISIVSCIGSARPRRRAGRA